MRHPMMLAVAGLLAAAVLLGQSPASAPSTRPATQPATQPATRAGAMTVTVKVFDLKQRSAEPVKTVRLPLVLSDARPPERPFREADPYGPVYRLEISSDGAKEAEFWYFLIARAADRFNIDYAGQAVHFVTTSDLQEALNLALEWLRPELSAQYSQLLRSRSSRPTETAPCTAPASSSSVR